MPRLHSCTRVDGGYLDNAPHRYVHSIELAITPEQAFEVLCDAESWPRWVSAITDVQWTTPEPHGIGTTRTVSLRGGLTGHEEFYAWEAARHMAFRFSDCSIRGITAFAEDYRIVPAPNGSRLTWTVGMSGDGVTHLSLLLFRPLMHVALRRFLRALRKLTDQAVCASTLR